ncbi:MAG: biopolymer transporter ExbD [Kiritimatiellae bacterium]|nr:biopolymer transporter ExbD [Kiritimatiellia bacterium]
MGRERRKSRGTKAISDVNMTPLIDLTFLLLIAFILAFPAIEQGIRMQLPKANAEKIEEKKSRTISIRYGGGLFLDNRETDAAGLSEALAGIAAEEPQPPVLVRCDERVEYGEMMKTLRLLHDAKITRMALVTEPTK